MNRLKLPLLLCLFAGLPHVAKAAVTAVQVVGRSATQALLSYTAPDNNACTVQVSPSNSYSPLVHDVDPTLFAGANMDNRLGSVGVGTTQRIFVIGKRAAERAGNGNYYSRALQAYTAHYYQITCDDGSKASGWFQTENIPTGMNYSDPLPVDPTNPGSYAWPTFSATDRTEQIVDPQSGLLLRHLTLPQDGNGGIVFDAGFYDYCSPVLATGSSGHQGYRCLLSSTLYFIDHTTGEAILLGHVQTPGQAGTEPIQQQQPCFTTSAAFDNADPNTFYCPANVGTGSPFKSGILKVTYQGANAPFSGSLPSCGGGANPCLNWQLLTPGSTNKDLGTLVGQFDSSFAARPFGLQQLGTQNVDSQHGYVLYYGRASQNGLGWTVIFDPHLTGTSPGCVGSGPGCVIAAMNSWSAPGYRWSGLHSNDTLGGVSWASLGYDPLSGNTPVSNGHNATAGVGPYSSLISAATSLKGTPQQTCPTQPSGNTVDNWPTGQMCDTVVVDTEPINRTAALGENPYLQDAIPGDTFCNSQISEFACGGGIEEMRLLIKNETTWVLQRGYKSSPMLPTSTPQKIFAYGTGGPYWDFINNPHGKNANGKTVVPDTGGSGQHAAYRPNAFVQSGATSGGVSGYGVRQGGVPAFFDAPQTVVKDFASFDGRSGVTDVNSINAHPNAVWNNQWFQDGRCYWGGGSGTPAQANPGQSLGNGIYKFGSNAYGGTGNQIGINPEILPTFAFCGTEVLKDVSGRASSILSSPAYTYCIAKNANECYSGSTVGNIYVNCPNVTQPWCTPGNGNGADNNWDKLDICLADNSNHQQQLIQGGIAQDLTGASVRTLSAGMSIYRREDVFWNPQHLQDGSWMFFDVPQSATYGPLSGQLLLGQLPPYPGPSSILRDNFMLMSVTAPPPPAGAGVDNAIVEFGYAEHGAANQFFCTSRQEACVKGTEAGNAYDYISDNVTGVSCASGCTIPNVPMIPQRSMYYEVQYRKGTSIVASGPIQVMTEADTTPVSQTLTSISLSPVGSQVYIGTSLQFTATANDQFGKPMGQQPAMTWSLSSVSAGTITTSGGLFTAGSAAGSYTVKAVANGTSISSTTAVIVTTTPLPTVVQAPQVVFSADGKSGTLSVLGSDLPLSESSLIYTWQVPTTVRISTTPVNGTNAAKQMPIFFTQSGPLNFQVTIQNPTGGTTIANLQTTLAQIPTQIQVDSSSGTSPNILIQLPDKDLVNQNVTGALAINMTYPFSAVVQDQFGGPIQSAPVAWSVSPSANTTIDSLGNFMAKAQGAYNITARAVNGVTGTQLAWVDPPVIDSLTATPNPVTGTQTTLSASGHDDSGPTSFGYFWQSQSGMTFSNLNSPNPTVTFTQGGSFDLMLTLKDAWAMQSSQSITVKVNSVASSMVISQPSGSLQVATSYQLSAKVFDQFGIALGAQPTITWNPPTGGSGATVDSAGNFKATNAGTYTVTATGSGITGSVKLVVNPAGSAPPVINSFNTSFNSNGTQATVTVAATDPHGLALSYQWTAPAGVQLGNATTSALQATFKQKGSYLLGITVTNSQGAGVWQSTTVVVSQLPTSLNVSAPPGIETNTSYQFFPVALDQFNLPLNPMPSINCAATPVVNDPGFYGSGFNIFETATPGTYTVSCSLASAASVKGQVTFTVFSPPPPKLPTITSLTTVYVELNVPFFFQLTTNSEPNTYQITSGALPAGLSLAGNTGEITGLPTFAGDSTVTIKPSNSAGAGTPATMTFHVMPTPSITSSLAIQGIVGVPLVPPYHLTTDVPATSFAFTGSLPAGLTFNSTTGMISGTPTTSNVNGENQISVIATNLVGPGPNALITFFINPAGTPPLALPYYVDCGAPIPYTDSQGTVWIADTNRLGGNTASFPGHTVNNTNDPALYDTFVTSTIHYLFSVPPGEYLVTLKFADWYDTTAGQDVFDVNLNNVDVLPNFDLYKAAGPAASAYDKTFLARDFTGTIDINFFPDMNGAGRLSALSIVPTTVVETLKSIVVTPPAGSFQTGQIYTFTAVAYDAQYGNPMVPQPALQWHVSPPAGATINSSGQFGASALGTYQITASSGSITSAPITVTVSAFGGPGVPIITSPLQSGGAVGSPYTYQITATNSPTSFSAPGLPPGLFLADTTTGLISGTPAIADTFAVSLMATNALGTGPAAPLTLVITSGPTLPTPDLSGMPSVLPLDATLRFSYDPGFTNLSYNWAIAPATTAQSAALAFHAQDAAPVDSMTQSPSLGLSTLSLTVGTYQVSVYVSDTQGGRSLTATKTVTFVPADLSSVKVYPDPWRADKHSGNPMTFIGLPSGSTIKIFTVSGRLARTLPADSRTWDLANDSGVPVASGLYLYLITDGQGNKARGKLAIMR